VVHGDVRDFRVLAAGLEGDGGLTPSAGCILWRWRQLGVAPMSPCAAEAGLEEWLPVLLLEAGTSVMSRAH
jgi:hypothetical protein